MCRKRLACFLLAVLTAIGGLNILQKYKIAADLPSEIVVPIGKSWRLGEVSEEMLSLDGACVQARSSGDERLGEKCHTELVGVEKGSSTLTLDVLGIPVKKINVTVGEGTRLIPGGQAIGVALHTKGALIVGTTEVLSPDGSKGDPAKQAGLRAGDVISAVNGAAIDDSTHLSELVNSCEGEVTLTIEKDGITSDVNVSPRKDASDGRLRLGLWVRDSTAGVGTLTFIDKSDGSFGALGHAITDVDTRSRLNVKNGEIYESGIVDVKQGSRGEPGELLGSFGASESIGKIVKNTDFGIFGDIDSELRNPLYPDGVELARNDQVKLGNAELLTTVDNEGIKRFSCKIIKLQNKTQPTQRGMIVQITDERLLEATGGIVQGMSGSPIIQSGRLVGALTHVMVNEPERGYGVFAQTMLEQSKIAKNEAA